MDVLSIPLFDYSERSSTSSESKRRASSSSLPDLDKHNHHKSALSNFYHRSSTTGELDSPSPRQKSSRRHSIAHHPSSRISSYRNRRNHSFDLSPVNSQSVSSSHSNSLSPTTPTYIPMRVQTKELPKSSRDPSPTPFLTKDTSLRLAAEKRHNTKLQGYDSIINPSFEHSKIDDNHQKSKNASIIINPPALRVRSNHLYDQEDSRSNSCKLQFFSSASACPEFSEIMTQFEQLENELTIMRLLHKNLLTEVYEAREKNGNNVILKIENETGALRHTIEREYDILSCLKGAVGIPNLRAFGKIENRNGFTLEYVGDNLETLLEKCRGQFSLKTVLMLVDQMISRVEYIHSRGIVHRNIKPDVFAMGLPNNINETTVHIIDFAVAKRYRFPLYNPPSGYVHFLLPVEEEKIDKHEKEFFSHITFSKEKEIVGTARFASKRAQMGMEQSRRDDMESLGYTIVYFLKGRLPWQGIIPHRLSLSRADSTSSKKTPHHPTPAPLHLQSILQKKMQLSSRELCDGLPIEFVRYFEHCSSLNFEDRPDYNYLRNLFRTCFERMNFVWDNTFDWKY